MDSHNLSEINKANAAQALSETRHQELLAYNAKVSDTLLSATSALISYLEGATTKTEVINQVREVATPDVKYVVEALQVLHEQLKTHKNTDLSEVTSVMRELLAEAKALPKTLPDAPSAPIDYTSQLTGLKDAIEAVSAVVKAQELIAEAPIVNVDAPVINVDAPDLTALQSGFKDVVKAVNKIVIPEHQATDTGEIEKLLKKSNKLLDQILDKPVGGGGGGAGRATPYEVNGIPTFVDLQQGALPTITQSLAVRIETAGLITYIGKALPGSNPANAVWQIQKIDETSGSILTWADGDARYDNIYNNRASLNYI